jgi:hypothetical protein
MEEFKKERRRLDLLARRIQPKIDPVITLKDSVSFNSMLFPGRSILMLLSLRLNMNRLCVEHELQRNKPTVLGSSPPDK